MLVKFAQLVVVAKSAEDPENNCIEVVEKRAVPTKSKAQPNSFSM